LTSGGLINNNILIQLREGTEDFLVFVFQEVQVLNGSVVIANRIPYLLGILPFLFQELFEERILDGHLELSHVFDVRVRPYWFNRLGHLSQDECRGSGRSDSKDRGVAATVAFEDLWFSEFSG